jgi:hypothetical protein
MSVSQRPATCCPFHVDGGDPALPCAPDIPASHFDPAEMAQRMFACANYADIELRVLATHGLPDPRTTTMRDGFELFYGTRTGRFSSQPSFSNKPKKDPER